MRRLPPATPARAAVPAAEPRGDRRAVRIGITGPIGCGKSTVARWLRARGAVVVDADAEARAVTAPGQPAFKRRCSARFGDAVTRPGREPGPRRARPDRLRRRLTHCVTSRRSSTPRSGRGSWLRSRPRTRRGAPAVVIEAIKLVEGGLGALCDEIWLVTCTAAEQRVRLADRGVAPDDAARRIGAQEGSAARLARSVARVIDTGGGLTAAEARVIEAYAAARAAAARGADRSRHRSTPQ